METFKVGIKTQTIENFTEMTKQKHHYPSKIYKI